MAKAPKKPKSKPLSGNERRLIEEFSAGFSLSTAMARAGIKTDDSKRMLEKLKENPAFARALETRRKEVDDERVISEERVIDELASIAFADIIDFYDEKGNLRKLRDIPPHARRAIVGISQRMLGSGDDGEIVTEYKLADKLNALEKLGKKLKLFSDQGGDTNVNLNINYRPTDQLVSRFLELIRKAGAVGNGAGIEAPRINQQVVDVLPE
jgi:phage terminase small subunit